MHTHQVRTPMSKQPDKYNRGSAGEWRMAGGRRAEAGIWAGMS